MRKRAFCVACNCVLFFERRRRNVQYTRSQCCGCEYLAFAYCMRLLMVDGKDVDDETV